MTERQRFRDQIVASFGTDELETLCRDAGVDPDLIPGKDDGKEQWVDELITYFERRGKLPALLAALKWQRGDQTWSYTPAPFDLADAPRKLPIGLIAGGIALVAIVLIGIAVLSRGMGTATPAATATATTPITPTAAPKKMPAFKTNIFIADLGLIENGSVVSIPEGVPLSAYLIDGLNVELKSLPAAVQSDFQPAVWSSADATANGWRIGPIGTLTDAQRVGEQLGAQIVIYGNVITASGASHMALDFYVPQALKTADELAGGYAIGKPIPMLWPATDEVWKGVQLALNRRQQLISRLAIGIAYDQAGQPQKALDIFSQAATQINPPCGEGREVLQFFIGREQLLLGNSQEAMKAHGEALTCKPDFARALIGMGDANLQATRALSPELRLQSDTLQAAIDNYALAEKNALAEGHVQLATLARLGAGLTQQLVGSTYFTLDDYERAQQPLADAIRLMTQALADLSKRPDGQKRTLAIGYSLLGTANWYSAIITPESDADTAKKFLSQAKDDYNQCIALVPEGAQAADETLTRIVQTCKNNLEKMGQ